MTQFVRVKQHIIMQAFKNQAVVASITVESYFETMDLHFNEFKQELYDDMARATSLAERLEYLNLVEFDFKEIRWLFHSSFGPMLFPEIVAGNSGIKKNLTRSMMFAPT